VSAEGDGQVWLDGRLVPAAEAAISPFDHGFTVGDGVFETCKVVRGEAFALGRHLTRLRRSAHGLGIDLPWDHEELRRGCDEAIAAAGGANTVSRLRITATSGPGPLGSGRGDVAPTLLIVAAPSRPWPPSAPVATVPWPRNERAATAGLKTTSYAENVVALAEAHRLGASEAIFANTAGDLCEGTGSNVFLAVDGRLLTPPLSSGCLAGITRELVLELVEVEVTPLPLGALADAEEAFLTSSTRDVQPISAVDGQALPTCPGPRTQAAVAALAALEARTLDP
jgi:branched-chain amino acid aminotransferase